MTNKLFGTIALVLLVVTVFGQVDSTGTGGTEGPVFTLVDKISYVITAILGVLSVFFKTQKDKAVAAADKAVLTVTAKATSALSLASQAIDALKDGAVTPAEIDRLVTTYKELKA